MKNRDIIALVLITAMMPSAASADESRWDLVIRCAGSMKTAATMTAGQETVKDIHVAVSSLRDSATKMAKVGAPGRGFTEQQVDDAIEAQSRAVYAKIIAAPKADQQSTFFSVMKVEMDGCDKIVEEARKDGLIQ